MMISKTKVRRSFTNEEDRHLRKLVRKFGSKNKWNEISALMKTRDPRQCRDRWNYYLSPKNNADKWTDEEDKLLFYLYEQKGRKWATFKPYFNGRTTVNIKSRWYFLNRNKHSNDNKSNNSNPDDSKNNDNFDDNNIYSNGGTNIADQSQNKIINNNESNNQILKSHQQKPPPPNFSSLHQFESGHPIFISSPNNQFYWNFNQNQGHLNNNFINNNNVYGNPVSNLINYDKIFLPTQDKIIYNQRHSAHSNSNSLGFLGHNQNLFHQSEQPHNVNMIQKENEEIPTKKDDLLDFDVNFEDFDEFINSLFSVNEQ